MQAVTQKVAVGLALAMAAGAAGSASKTYTLDADFALGLLENLNYNAPNANQLQLNAVGAGSKFLFIANHNEASVSKYDTVLNREVARYRTYANVNGNPSRIAIDVDGNAYVLNREPGTGLPPQLLKILVDTAIDRNGNGVVDSSVDTNNDGIIQPAEMLAFTANNDSGNPAVFADERIAWAKRIGTGTSFGRSLCIAPDGKLWVGVWNQQRYYRVDPANGNVIPLPNALPYVQMSQWSPYGCTIDKNGILWSATLSQRLGRVDTATGAVSHFDSPFGSTYGISQAPGRIYQANTSGYTYHQFDTVANAFSEPSQLNFGSYGIAIDGAGNILSSNPNGGVAKHSPTGALLWQQGAQPGASFPFGVMIDGNNDVWVMNLSSNNMSKYRGTDGVPLGLFPVGNYPYVYTDGSGLTTKNTTNNKLGTWTVVQDGSAAGTKWGKVGWNAMVPVGGSVEVQVRAADTQGALELQSYVPVTNNGAFNAMGRYLQVRTRLTANNANVSPVLFDLTVSTAVTSCDVDGDGDIDDADIALVRAGVGQVPAAGDPRDDNGDGKITLADVRSCQLKKNAQIAMVQ
jgi:hypothetical protein